MFEIAFDEAITYLQNKMPQPFTPNELLLLELAYAHGLQTMTVMVQGCESEDDIESMLLAHIDYQNNLSKRSQA